MSNKKIHAIGLRSALFALWALLAVAAVLWFAFERGAAEGAISWWIAAGGYGALFVALSLRGLSLIPSTYVIVPSLLLFRPVPLYIVALAGSLASALLVYSFSDSFGLAELFERRHSRRLANLSRALEKREFLIVFLWTLQPIIPADLIAYACGAAEVPRGKMLLGMLVGQGIYYAALIAAGGALIGHLAPRIG